MKPSSDGAFKTTRQLTFKITLVVRFVEFISEVHSPFVTVLEFPVFRFWVWNRGRQPKCQFVRDFREMTMTRHIFNCTLLSYNFFFLGRGWTRKCFSLYLSIASIFFNLEAVIHPAILLSLALRVICNLVAYIYHAQLYHPWSWGLGETSLRIEASFGLRTIFTKRSWVGIPPGAGLFSLIYFYL